MKGFDVLKLALVATGIAAVFISGASAAETYKAPNIVENTIPESLAKNAGNAEAGRKIVINRKQGNCLACHAISSLDNQPFHGEVGPSLDEVSKRYSEAEMRLIVVDPKKVFEGTIMPAFYKKDGFNRVNKKFKDKTILSAQQVEDVIAFLKSQ